MITVITVVGEALVDIIVDPAGEVSSVVGGAPVNTARAAARLGVEAEFLGGISADGLGTRIRNLLEKDGVRIALANGMSVPTTLAIAALDDSGAATYRFLVDGTSSAVVTPELARAHLDPATRALHVGTLGLVLQPLASASVALVRAATDQQIVMVDPNCRPSVMDGSSDFTESLHAVLGRADVVKVSGDDLEFLFPGLDSLAAAAQLQADCGATVLFTDGARSVRILTHGAVDVLDVPSVPVVDTVGAGDSFSGGFLAYWMKHGLGRDELSDPEHARSAARFGIAVAAITCQRAGADPPYSSELTETGDGK